MYNFSYKSLKPFSSCSFSWLVVALTVVGTLLSCENEEEVGAIPAISGITLVDSTRTELLESTTPGTTILISGSNFNGLSNLKLNGLDFVFNPNFVQNNSIILTIPKEIEKELAEVELTQNLEVTTKWGTASYNFSVFIAGPAIFSINKSSIVPGDLILLEGSYFKYIQKIIFPGDIETTDFEVLEDGTILSVTVPEDVKEGEEGEITVVGKFGSATYNNFNRKTLLLANFDDLKPGYYNWAAPTSSSNETFSSISGDFVYMLGDAISKSYWNQSLVFAVESTEKQLFSNLFEAEHRASELVLSFDFAVNKTKPFNGTYMYLSFTTGTDANSKGIAYGYDYYPKASNNNEWYTVSIPLSEFKYNGIALQNYGELLNGTKQAFLWSTLNQGDTDVEIEMAVDNLRIVDISPK